MSQPHIQIDGQVIKNYGKPYLIAEISGNHKGDIQRIYTMMDAAKAAGFSAVKIQYFTADDMTLDSHDDDFVVQSGMWVGRTLYSLYKEGSVKKEWLSDIFAYGKSLDITVFSSIFSADSLSLLESLNCPAYKVASFEAMDLPLIEAIAALQKPFIISTGIIDEQGISDVINVAQQQQNNQLCLLHCISNYPAVYGEFNLATLKDMMVKYPYPIGLSDHSIDHLAVTSAIALGASVIEKHITIDRDDGAIDSKFSIPINELESFCMLAKQAYEVMGVSYYGSTSPRKNYRSLYAIKEIKKGELFTPENIKSIRPGHGIAPKHFKTILGKTASQDIKRASPINWKMVKDEEPSRTEND